MPSDPLVYVLVLAWNHKADTIECLGSLLQSSYAHVRFAVIDNGSTDGTADEVRRLYPSVEIIGSLTNLGIAGGYNLGLQHALQGGAGAILIANNDIACDPGMIGHLVAAMERQGDAGMAMPKIYHYYGDRSRPWCTGATWRLFPPGVKMMGVNARDSAAFSERREIAYAPSCCLLLRREALLQVGLFDTGYFFYNDDWDLSARLRQAGYKILFVPEARMWHKVSISTQKSDKPARWWRYLGRSTVRFYLRHSTPLVLVSVVAWFVIRECIKLKFARIGPFLGGVREEALAERLRRQSARLVGAG